ncbi:MAG TPA: hypothetical protein VJ323_03625 [Bryobacteraceae bacterium]|jgi:hypothetical protein|nr:hypothetical protein [Bryobacteraceae bacterium]
MAQKPDNTLYLLGKYIGLATLLPAGAFAGYLIARFLEHYIHWSGLLPFAIILGVVSSLYKIIEELLRDTRRAEERDRRNADGKAGPRP